MASLPVRLSVLRALVNEIETSSRDDRPLVVGGAREVAAVLRKQLGVDAGGDDPRGAAVLVYVLGAEDDEAALRRARRARVPIVAVATREVDAVPYVLATDVVRVRPGEGFPVDEIARAVARRLGEEAAPLAARLPVLRRAVAEQLVGSLSLRNGIVAAAVFAPGADLPVLALNQLRLVLRVEQAYGLRLEPQQRLPELVAAFGAAFGLRAVARELLDVLPVPRWAVQGAVAYAGTRALGEAALGRLAAGSPGRQA